MNISDTSLESKRAGHGIQIHTDSKRWWPKTMYHTYWSKLYYWIRKNILFVVIFAIFATFMSMTMNMLYSTRLRMLKQAMFNDMEEATNKGFRLQPHHDRLVKTLDDNFLPPDTLMDWVQTNSSKPRAAFVVITREEELFRLRTTMIELEERFNTNHNYPWVIISDKPLSRKFREWVITTTEAPVYFGQAPQIEWNEPYWIDVKRVEEGVKNKVNEKVKHGENISWRRMTRYAAGYLAYHPLLKDLEFYWKVQPGSSYSCNILGDPFQQMKDENKKFSFLLTLTENHLAVVDFEYTIKQFILDNKRLIQPISNSIYPALLHDKNKQDGLDPSLEERLGEYSGKISNCHIYNNFMITSLSFLRSDSYRLLFEYMDDLGGFFYERWSDAFFQTFAVALFLDKKEISMADITGYTHSDASSCPSDLETYKSLGCMCDPKSFRVYKNSLCLPKFHKHLNPYYRYM